MIAGRRRGVRLSRIASSHRRCLRPTRSRVSDVLEAASRCSEAASRCSEALLARCFPSQHGLPSQRDVTVLVKMLSRAHASLGSCRVGRSESITSSLRYGGRRSTTRVMGSRALFLPSDDRATLRLRRNYGNEPRARARRSGVVRCFCARGPRSPARLRAWPCPFGPLSNAAVRDR
jgi:hypothetical protein